MNRDTLPRLRRVVRHGRGGLLICLLMVAAMSGQGLQSTSAPSGPPAPVQAARSGPLDAVEKVRVAQVRDFLAGLDGDLASHQNELAGDDLYIVSSKPELALASTDNSMITIPRPYVLYDSNIQRYYAVATYHFNVSTAAEYWFYDGKCSSLNTVCNVGGPDGFAMRFNQNVVNRSVQAVFCPRTDLASGYPQFSGCINPTNPDENSSQGVAYRHQDKLFYNVHPDYTMHSGQIMMQIDPIKCGVVLQIFSQYAHTWSSTSLTSFTVSLSSFSASFSSTSSHWKASSQSGTWQRC